MTEMRHSIVGQPDERGSALIGVLLLLMMMTALVAALAVGGQTETLVSRNQHSGAQAQAAAEAGLNHAVELASTYIFEWAVNDPGGWTGPGDAVDALLKGPDGLSGTELLNADNTSLGARAGIDAAAAIPLDARRQIDGGVLADADASIIAEYEAIIMDDDATAPAAGPWVEDGLPFNDLNRRLIVRATGYGPDNTRVVLEAIISPLDLSAVVTNGDLDIDGNSVTIDGTGAGVHSNGDLTVSGGGDGLGGTISTSGTYDGPDDIGAIAGAAEMPVPEVRASDYRIHADFILKTDPLTGSGIMTDAAGVVQCVWSKKTPCNNWDFNDATGGWSFANSAPPTGTYYVEGDVNVSSGPTVEISIIAEGSISISGSPTMTPATPELLFVTDEDLKITGSLDAADPDINVQGQMLVHGQVDIFGNIDLRGQLIVEDADVGGLVPTGGNSIGGNVTITYNGSLGTAIYSLTGWRDIRQ